MLVLMESKFGWVLNGSFTPKERATLRETQNIISMLNTVYLLFVQTKFVNENDQLKEVLGFTDIRDKNKHGINA